MPALLAPGTAALQAKVAEPFTATLRSDLEYSGAFAVAEPAHYPAGYRDPDDARGRRIAGAGRARRSWSDTRGEVSGDRVSVEARVWDLASRKMILGRRYSGGVTYVERIAHTVANDIVKQFTGKDGPSCRAIVFVLGPRRDRRRSTRWTSTGERPRG